MKPIIQKHPEASLITVLFFILAIIYSFVTPLFEASDEIFHFPVIHHISTTGQLPTQDPEIETLWEQEGSQPPLYYILGSALTFWIDTSDIEEVRWQNPHAKLGIPLDPDNKNMVIHTERESQWRGTVLAVRIVRFFSVLLGIGSVIFTYLIARTIYPDQKWLHLTAMILVAFNPMFLFITGSVNNDNLMIFLSSWILLILIRILTEGITNKRAATLSIIAALATITKLSGLTLFPLIGLVFLIHALKTGRWKETFITGFKLTGAWLLLGSWWYIRNITLYGEFLGLKTFVAVAGGREIPLLELRREWYGFWVSYWGLFGSVDILMDKIFYRLYSLITWAALAGSSVWLFFTIKKKQWKSLLIPGLLIFQIGIVFIGVLRWTMTTYASQGRLMFPAISIISVLLSFGLLTHLPQRWRQISTATLGLILFLIAALSPFRYIAPAYAHPEIVESLPDGATPINAHFEGLEIVGVEIDSVNIKEGGHIPITVYWRATETLTENYSIYLHALGREYTEIGKIDSYPGAGALPTTQMEPGVIIKDQYWLELEPEFTSPTILRVIIGAAIWSEETGYTIFQPTNDDGQTRDAVILEAGVTFPKNESACTGNIPDEAKLIAEFGGFATLSIEPLESNYKAGDEIPITLHWSHAGPAPANLTVFVHLIGEDGTPLAQADSPPLNGDYPTHLWFTPCQVADTHILRIPDTLPDGDYRILVGFYDASDPAFGRTPATTPDGSPYPDYAVPIATITVEAE